MMKIECFKHANSDKGVSNFMIKVNNFIEGVERNGGKCLEVETHVNSDSIYAVVKYESGN